MKKEKVLQLAREVGAGEPESLYGRTDYVVMTVGDLERFAALIEREVRGDAEPVAFIGTDGNLSWLKKPEVLYSKAVPLFMRPTFAVVRQLVEALELTDNVIRGMEQNHGNLWQVEETPDYLDEICAKARAALAAVKEHGL